MHNPRSSGPYNPHVGHRHGAHSNINVQPTQFHEMAAASPLQTAKAPVDLSNANHDQAQNSQLHASELLLY